MLEAFKSKGLHSKVLLLSSITAISILFSFGKVYGSQRCLPEWLFFTWTTALERILTVDNLRKRRVIIIDWCCMCKAHGESVNHLLLHCIVAHELWSLIFALFGIAWVMPRGVVDLLSCWSDRFGKSEADAIWKVIPHCLMWCIWRERNNRAFVGEEQSIPALKSSFLQTYTIG